MKNGCRIQELHEAIRLESSSRGAEIVREIISMADCGSCDLEVIVVNQYDFTT